jgi:fibronectin-binding autotransporter adhesin
MSGGNLKAVHFGLGSHKSAGSKKAGRLAILAAAIAMTGANWSAAGTFIWDSSGTSPTAPTDGPGSWDTANPNWSDGTNDNIWNNANGDTAVFGNGGAAGTGAISVTAGGITAGGIVFGPLTSGDYNFSGGTITLGSGGINAGSLSSGTISFSDPLSLSASQSWIVGGGLNLADSGVISSAAAVTLTKLGAGTETLSNAETYTGTTAINAGTLNLNFNAAGAPASNILAASALSMGGGTLLVTGAAGGASQSFTTTVFAAGTNTISLVSNGTTPSLSLGAITLTTGAAVDFVGPLATNVSTATGTITTSTGTANTLLGSYATVGQYDWAAVTGAGAPFSIQGLSQVSGGYTSVAPSTSIAAVTNADFIHNTTSTEEYRFSGGAVFTTIRFNDPLAKDNFSGNVTGGNVGFEIKAGNTISYNGIMVTPNIGANNVVLANEGGIGTTSDLRINGVSGGWIWQNNSQGFLIVNTNTALNSTGTTPALTYAGSGTVEDLGTGMVANSYAGQTFLDGGVVIGGPGLFPATTVNLNGGTVLAGGVYNTSQTALVAGSVTYSNAISARNGGGVGALGGATLNVTGAITGSGSVNVGYGQVPGTGAGTANTTALTGSGTVFITNSASNTFSGGTNVIGGSLQVDTTTGTPLGTGLITVAGGILDGVGTLTNAVAAKSGVILPGDPTAIGTLTLGSLALSGGTVTFYNNGSNTDLLALTGPGVSVTAASTIDFYSSSTQTGTSSVTTAGAYDLFGVASAGLATSQAATLESDLVSSIISIAGKVSGDSYSFGSSGNFITLNVSSANVNANWTTNGSSNWNNGANWTPGIPHIAADSATFGTNGGTITAGSVNVLLDANETVGSVTFNNAGTSYAITQGGSNTLTLDSTSGGNVNISVLNGSHSIGVPINLNGSLGISVAATDVLSISGPIANGTAAAPTLTMSGAGTTVLTAANNYGGSSSATNTLITGGTLQLGDGVSAGSVFGTISVTSPGTLAIDPPVSGVFSNTVIGSGSLAISAPSGVVVTVNNSNIGLTGSTVVKSGTLQLGTVTAIGPSTLNVLSGGQVDLNGLSPALDGLGASVATTGGVIDSPTATSAITITDNQSSATTYSGSIQNSNAGNGGVISLTMAGSGTLNLTGSSTYGGNTSVTAGTLAVGNGGNINVGSGNVLLNGGTMVINGGAFTTTGNLGLQTGSTQPAGFITIGPSGSGGNITVGSTTIGAGSGSSVITVDSGTVSLGAFVDDRDSTSATGSTTSGLIVNGGNVTISSAHIGVTNSSGNMTVNGGNVTIGSAASTGAFLIGDLATPSTRSSDITVTNGSVTYLGTDGLILANTATAAAMSVSGGTVTTTGITMNPTAGSGGTVSLTTTGGSIYLGNVGIVNDGGASTSINLNGGTLGAISNWSSSANMGVGGSVTIQAADASAIPHNIALSGNLSGNGGNINITGAGMVTLGGSNTYGGGTNVAGGSILLVTSTDAINGGVGSGPVSVSGTIGGNGFAEAPVTIMSGGTLAPGGALPGGAASQFNVSNLTLNSGANVSLALGKSSTSGPAGGNDSINVTGSLTTNVNTALNVIAAAGFSYSTYPLITYNSLTDDSSDFSGWSVTGVAPGTGETFSSAGGKLSVSLVAPSAPAAPGAPDFIPPFVPPTPNNHPANHFVGYNENVTNTSGLPQTEINIVLNGNFSQAGDVIVNYDTFADGTNFSSTYNSTTNTTTLSFAAQNSADAIAAGHVGHVGYSLINGTGGGEEESPETAYKYWGALQSAPGSSLRLPAPSWFVTDPGQGANTVFVILYSTIELSNGQVAGEWDEQQVPANQPFQIGLGNNDNLDGPMFAFNVGFQFSPTEIPLDDLNSLDYPPSSFTPVPGITDASPIDPGSTLLSQPLTSPDLPEPASLGLVGMGSLLALRRRRRLPARA